MINNIVNSKFFAGLTAAATFAGVVATAGVANAAALIGEFNLSSLGSAELTKDSLTFVDIFGNTETNPDDPTENSIPIIIAPATATGSFSQFAGINTKINGIVFFDPSESPNQFPNPFIDFGGGNEFILENVRLGEVIQSGENASVDVILDGIFVSENGEQTDGAGNLTFQFNDTLASTIEAQLDAGETLDAQFSGALFSTTASTPEPTALFGLGVVGAGLVATRKRKKDSKVKIW